MGSFVDLRGGILTDITFEEKMQKMKKKLPKTRKK